MVILAVEVLEVLEVVILAVRLVAAAAGQKVKIPVVALLGVVVVMVAWAVDHLLVMAAAAMAS